MPKPMDGTYICTQEIPPPVIQFQVEVSGAVLTKPMTGEEFKWNEANGWWEHVDSRHTIKFYDPSPPEVPNARWSEVDTRTQPHQSFAGTWA